ncbi:L-serine ammonia-lyase, iron-sulfur-dependent, subunit alpha [Mobilibacterium timonense]|uniref:L-serine ammonia-lyase, iron-sulfur-dependent, subunit alpha n=1 Tax=Mobilibacterium timonense TaxID=1871012 RepID=UPI000985D557|nr:L-serine ammonia-lyase, iron-sulfur-dependent, subunit alpha [Mobilibacterium timonense]
MFGSFLDILEECKENNTPFWETVCRDDCREEGISEEESLERMRAIWQAMVDSDRNYDEHLKSKSGLTGMNAAMVKNRREKEGNNTLCSEFESRIMERALRISESNACMKRIVAAPTAGSCGVVPAVLITMQEKFGFSDEKMIQALYVTAGIGGVIGERACLSGAEGGCQAEVGSASGMAAGAAVWLLGGSDLAIIHACAMALSGLMGLVCDPVAGLVEIPCVRRNVVGAANAVTAADMALAGLRSTIPPDQVVDAMKSVGRQLPESLRETGKGGLAATPAGREISRRLNEGSVGAEV